ncbi:unnamed protein product [Schistocephalus solidus]|uniref:Calnexin n=1 Tax=Schistocephalus solidus TaxID=70667 RepID=A0A183SNK1_SCHSO|nr:unnamed protein product [Schistocephalus solidus]
MTFVLSKAKKEGVEDAIAKYDGLWDIEIPSSSAIDGDHYLILKSKNKHHAIATDLGKEFQFTGNEFVLQYEVNFLEGISCGGGYVKLLSASPNLDLTQFHDKTPYTIMFGPDKCGMDMKIHFIFRHRNPKTGVIEEKHAKQSSKSLDTYFSDKKTHLYTLVVRSDNSFEIYVDQTLVNSGNLLKDVNPPVNPPNEIDDPNDKKPADWDDRAKIPDPTAKKPDDWDETAPEFIIDEDAVMPEGWLENEPTLIPDESSKKPDDWDDATDGEWEAPKIENPACKDAPGCGKWSKPLVKNPKYKGKWSPPLISNPAYKGEWHPKRIPNPDFYEDKEPYKMTPIRALGLELWSLSDQIAFDNFYIGTSKKGADDFAAQTWALKHSAELAADTSAKSVVDAIKEVVSEKPWVVALVLLAVLVPLLLICIFCCRSSPEETPSEAAAHHKKTDEPVVDDENATGAVVEEVEESPAEEDEEEEPASKEAGDAEKVVDDASEDDHEIEDEEVVHNPEDLRRLTMANKSEMAISVSIVFVGNVIRRLLSGLESEPQGRSERVSSVNARRSGFTKSTAGDITDVSTDS